VPVCPTCGKTLEPNARFCPDDGTTVRADTAPPEAAAPLFSRTELGSAKAKKSSKDGGDDDALVGALIDGRYRVDRKLGQGGVGAVYAAEHVETKRPVAVKVLHPAFAGSEEFHKRFEREARAASKLTHPSCVSVLDFGRVDRVEPVTLPGAASLLGTPYLVMEFVRGKPLVDELVRNEPMAPAEAVVIARGVLSALKHAHGLGIVHRDVKPANVMLVEGGGTSLVVKLLDFGLAKMSDGDSEEKLTQAGTVFGTPGYLSPEQASGKPADARSDLYALAVMLYELVVGRRPFMHADPLDVVRDHLSTPPVPPRSRGAKISDALEAAILRGLQKSPNDRFATAEEFSAALAKVPELRAPDAEPPQAPLPPTAKKTFQIDRRLAIGGAALVAAIVAVVVLALVMRKPPPATTIVVHDAPPPAKTLPPATEIARKHVAQAAMYQRRLWCSDALEELDRALRADAGLRDSEPVARIAVACLVPKTRDKATRFLVDKVGAAARPILTRAAADDPNPEVRKGAQQVLARLR
jgi:eukaryotic-like serine/threonine-protein kinase